ncbi:hypothetical protein WA026_009709 [Henosepilachna vigintioctopunctata]|uniref:Uncharacterized protein n=1 Tax=Henosepilachna vigintioctopunctata TaxID=420089 RepID=A0AAW1U9C1_9CUCU
MSIIESFSSINEPPAEVKLNKFFEEEEGEMIVIEICDELLKNVMDGLEAKYLESEAHQFIVECAIEAMKKAVEMNCYFHNVSYSSMRKGSWECDVQCETSPPDNWAAYKVPLSCSTNEKMEEIEIKPEEDEKDLFKHIFEATTKRLTSSSSSQSQDASLTDILEGLSSSDDEMHHPSWVNLIKDQQEIKEDVDKESITSAAETEKITLDFDAAISDEISKKVDISRDTYTGSSTFSKTAVGEFEKGLCVPQVGNVPVTNVVRELPGVESYLCIKKDKRSIKVVKQKPKILPRRRSDTNIKMIQVEEEAKEKDKKTGRRT